MAHLRNLGTAVFEWRPGRLAQHGGALLGWMLLRAAAQAGTVVLLARTLAAQTYGEFVAVIAVAGFVAPFAGLGLSHIVLRNAARDPAHEAVYFGIARRWWWLTLAPSALAAIVAAAMLLPGNLPTFAACIAIAAEIAATSFTELGARHRQAQQDMHAFGAIQAGLPLLRLLALIVLFLSLHEVSATAALWAYATSGLAYTGFLYWRLSATTDTKTETASEAMAATSGLPFSLAVFASRLQAEFNKPVLAQTSFGLAGNYNVAQRVVDMASLPLMALQEALWPRLHAQPDPMRQLRRTGLVLIAMALALGTAIWLAAPLLPLLLGGSFTDTVGTLRWLAWLPALQAFRALLNFQAIHHARMQLIGWAYALGATASVAGVSALVPVLGMTGAVIAGYAAEVAMIATLSRQKWRAQ